MNNVHASKIFAWRNELISMKIMKLHHENKKYIFSVILLMSVIISDVISVIPVRSVVISVFVSIFYQSIFFPDIISVFSVFVLVFNILVVILVFSVIISDYSEITSVFKSLFQ